MKQRVVITGLGILSPIGSGVQNFWRAVINGQSGVSELSAIPGINRQYLKGGLIKDFSPTDALTGQHGQVYGLGTRYAIHCAQAALNDAALDLGAVQPKRAGVFMGTTLGESQALEQRLAEACSAGQPVFANLPASNIDPANLALGIAKELRLGGPVGLFPAACAAGNYAISMGCEIIRSGQAEVMIAGGVEPFSKLLFLGFAKMRLTVPDQCRPFDKNRKGLLVSEGCGILILESYEHAKRRNAPIYGEVLGCGSSADAYHSSAPDPEGQGAVLAMERALANAGLAVTGIDYISAHGTGTRANDLMETKAIKKVFKDRAKLVPVSSIKSMIGHTMGAASAIEAVLCALILQHQMVPPTINYGEPDPECDLDYVPNVARELKVRRIISNAYGFYGQNASVIFGMV